MEVIGFIIGLIILLGIVGGFFFLIYYIIKRLVKGKTKKKPVHEQEIVKKYEPYEVVQINEYDHYTSVEYGDNSIIRRTYDEFDKTINFKFFTVPNGGNDKFYLHNEVYFGFGFQKIDKNYYLFLDSFKKEIAISKNDEIQILFHNKEIKNFLIEGNGVFKEKDTEGIKVETSIKLDNKDFQIFMDHDIDKIRYKKTKTKENFDFQLNIDQSSSINIMARNLFDSSENMLID
jgi:hypothetical protein